MRQPLVAAVPHVKVPAFQSLQPMAAAAAPQLSGPAAPSHRPVGFANVPAGTYQVHLHAICSGRQGYHLAYLPNLRVGSTQGGQILVPAEDFGRGWCVIVYADAARNVVLVTRPI